MLALYVYGLGSCLTDPFKYCMLKSKSKYIIALEESQVS